MIGLPDAIADGINNGLFKLDEKQKRIVTTYNEREVVVIDPNTNLLTIAENNKINQNSASKAYTLYQRKVESSKKVVANIKASIDDLERRKKNLTHESTDKTYRKTPEDFALSNLQTYTQIANSIDPKNKENFLENLEYAADLTGHLSNGSRKTQGLKLFVDDLIKAKKDLSISELSPEIKQQAQQEFSKLAQKQLPNAHEHITELALSYGTEESNKPLKTLLRPLVEQFAIESIYNPQRLFPSQKINRGLLCDFIANATLIEDKSGSYFVDNKGIPMFYNKNLRSFHHTTKDLALKNFDEFKSEYLPYMSAKKNIQMPSSGATASSPSYASSQTNPTSIPQFNTFSEEEAYWQKKLDESTTQLSKYAGVKLTHNNPNIADLSDLNRPTNIAEQYTSLYTDEYEDASAQLEQDKDLSERQVGEKLRNILLTSYNKCSTRTNSSLLESAHHMFSQEKINPQQIDDYVREWNSWLNFVQSSKDENRTIQNVTNEILIEMKIPANTNLASYVEKCSCLCYHMNKVSPPLILTMHESGDTVNSNNFNICSVRGKKVDYIVWPALFLHAKGPLLSKGTYEGIKGT